MSRGKRFESARRLTLLLQITQKEKSPMAVSGALSAVNLARVSSVALATCLPMEQHRRQDVVLTDNFGNRHNFRREACSSRDLSSVDPGSCLAASISASIPIGGHCAVGAAVINRKSKGATQHQGSWFKRHFADLRYDRFGALSYALPT